MFSKLLQCILSETSEKNLEMQGLQKKKGCVLQPSLFEGENAVASKRQCLTHSEENEPKGKGLFEKLLF